METRANFALIGAFVLMAVVAVLAFVLWLGSSQINREYAQYDIVFEGPVSLEEGASVRYIGIKVGEVESVRIDNQDASKVRARVRIDRETPVKTDSTAVIDFAGITGVTFVQINAGSENAGPLVVKPYQQVPVIPAGINPLAELFSSGTEIAGRASQALEQASALLTEENMSAVGETLQSVRTITGTLADNDETLILRATETLATLERAGDRLATASEAATDLSKSVDGELVSLNGELKALVAELKLATSEAKLTLAESRKAIAAATSMVEGPAAATVAQTGMAAQDLRILITRLDRVVRDLEQNPQSLVVGDPRPYEDR